MGSHQAGCSAHTQPSQWRFYLLLLWLHTLFINHHICVRLGGGVHLSSHACQLWGHISS